LQPDRSLVQLQHVPLFYVVEGDWSSGMIPASGAGGREFDSRITPKILQKSESVFRLEPRISCAVGSSLWAIPPKVRTCDLVWLYTPTAKIKIAPGSTLGSTHNLGLAISWHITDSMRDDINIHT
jgi:hypothetical protein